MLKTLFFGALLMTASFTYAEGKIYNLVPNPGFEKMSGNKLSDWNFTRKRLKGKIETSKDVKHSGNQALYIKSESENLRSETERYGRISGSTDFFPCSLPGRTILKCSVWGKMKNVVSPGKWFKARVVIYFFNNDKKRLKLYEILCSTGTLDWKKFDKSVTVPENTAFIKLSCSLTQCSGEAWFDDLEVKIDKTSLPKKETMTNLPMGKPIFFPSPWKINLKNNKIVVNGVALKTMIDDKRVNPALEKMLKEQGVAIEDKIDLKLITGNKTNKEIDQAFRKEFPRNNWGDIGDQGYFLCANANKIILGANTEQGRFYAVQTLRQLLKSGVEKEIETVSILDKPTVARRGAVISTMWFNRAKEEAVKRMSHLKMNTMLYGGGLMNRKLGFSHKTLKAGWRVPFTEDELNILKKYLELCRENFIEIHVQCRPRGLPETHYSSQKEIDLLVGKMEQLYNIGFRNMGINFDDLHRIKQGKLFYKDDIEKFSGDFGKAHAYFVDNVYKKLKRKCPDINFTVLPYAYHTIEKLPEKGDKSKQYLKNLGKGISPEIKDWIVCLYTQEEIDESKEISGRCPFIWDNFYTTGQLPAFPSPINRPNSLSNKNITGYVFLPAILQHEDASQISWLNAADYEWAPARYNPEESFKNAIAYVTGSKEATELLQEYSKFSLKVDDCDFPTENKDKRLDFLKKAFEKLGSFKTKFDILLPEKLAKVLKKDIQKYRMNLTRIADNLKDRPYPTLIYPKKGFVPSNQNALNNFIPLREEKSIKETEAWVSYDNENLYIKIFCKEPAMEKLLAKKTKRDSGVFQDDSIELFIMPKPEDASGHSTYYQIVINSMGAVYDAKFIHERFNHLHDQFKNWSANMNIKINKNADSWELNVTIPFKDLGMTQPEKGKRIFMNICRNRLAGGKHELSCYAMLVRGKFHDPLSFWSMEFK
jgi:hypothetical protein